MTKIWMPRWSSLVLAATLSVLSGCSPGKPAGHGHDAGERDHDHGEAEAKTAQVTVFGERFEIFTEHRLVVAGAPTKFVTHVTDIGTFEPRSAGPLRFQMRLGQAPALEHIEKSPSRPGIYEPSLTFPQAGDWVVAVSVPGDDAGAGAEFPVKVFGNSHDADHAHVPEPPEGISFLKEQQWRVRLGTAVAGQRRLVERLRLPAKVAARPGASAHVTPPIAGRVLVPPGKAMPMVGERVEAGQVLVWLQPSISEAGMRLLEAEAEVVRARLGVEQAEAAFNRVEALAKVQAKSARELQEAEFALRFARAKYEATMALQGTYRQAGTNSTAGKTGGTEPMVELRSPISGTIVAQSGAAVGEHVSAEKPLFTVLDASVVFIEANVPETTIGQLAERKAAFYELPGSVGQFLPVTGEWMGRFVFLGIAVDPATHTVPLVYEVRNAEHRLRVGQTLNLYVETDRAESALAVPHEAIVEEGGRPVLFVQVGGETFDKREVRLGIRDGDWVQVLSGLEAGERVVTQNAYAVRLASVASALPSHGHAH